MGWKGEKLKIENRYTDYASGVRNTGTWLSGLPKAGSGRKNEW